MPTHGEASAKAPSDFPTEERIQMSQAPQTPFLAAGGNALSFLQAHGLATQGRALRLHLGCGGVRLEGYVNIDYPVSEHPVQTGLAAEACADIASLRFPSSSVDEVRSHHVFEHFDRPIALALLCHWHGWLKPDGLLVIETPDLLAGARQLLLPWYPFPRKQAVIRHLFGSQEAHWAVHRDGWYAEKFRRVLAELGFGNLKIRRSKWRMLRNITVWARKTRAMQPRELRDRSVEILRQSLVDEGTSELRMWKVWQSQLDAALEGAH